jgi:hypothetical protein
MPTIERAVDFLITNNALELGASPWPTYDDDQEVYQIDWDMLFPPRRRGDGDFPHGDNWSIQPTQDELGALENALGAGQPDRQATSAEQQPQWDVCAWYQPVHFHGHSWGIFIKEDCVKRAAFMIARFVPSSVVPRASLLIWFKALYRAAVYVYFLHEHYHHKIECLGFRLHVVQDRSAYLPYYKLVYAGTKGTDDQLEEALANADCYHRLGTQPYALWLTPRVVKATREYLKWQFPQDPPGYRKAGHYLVKADFDAGEHELQAQVKEASLKPTNQPKNGTWHPE